MRVTDKPTIKRYYQALLDREASYVGTFYVAVKTTAIFCIATCRARKPKLENVEFYTTLKEVQNAGYRPCKVCRPTEDSHEAPLQVQAAIRLVKNHPQEKITDQRLIEENIRPELVRRWFNSTHGMTFHAFQRMYRINKAFEEVKNGRTTIDTAFDNGYESLSGFAYTYKKLIGKSPGQSKQGNVILIKRFTTPLGPMFACASERGLCLLEFVDRRMLETEFCDIQRLLQATIIAGENHHIRQAEQEIGEYFAGKRQAFDVTLDTPGSQFQNSVWQALTRIPFGSVTSYGALASVLKKPQAARAIARANGANRVAIVVPCHRVIGKNGELTGYGGGLERKRWLIEHERKVARNS